MGTMWGSGDAYEPFIGRWSRVVAPRFLDWLDAGPGRRWLDVGCGTGALTEAVLARCEPASVLAVDPSPAYWSVAAARVQDERVRFDTADACSLPAASADVAVSALVFNFVDDKAKALQSMRAAVGPGGLVAAYVWDYVERGMELLCRFWDAAAALDPGAAALDEGVMFPVCSQDKLAAAWRDSGLSGVEVEGIVVPTVFRDFDDYWAPFLGGQGPAPGYLQTLAPQRQAALRERLRSTLPVAADGSMALSARVWAVRGRA